MGRGRPRKHAKIHMLDGTYRPREHDKGADNVPAVGDCVPLRPLNTHGQKFFRAVLDSYPPGTLGASDAEELTTYAEYVQRRFALCEMERTGELDVLQAIKAHSEVTARCLQLASRFGTTPADRGRVKLSSPPEQDVVKAKFFGGTG